MAEDRLGSRDWRDLLGWILAGVIGIVLAFQFFFVAFPEASLDLRISRDEALGRAREFLTAQGYRLDGYQASIVFSVDDNAKTYLEREMGLEQANRLMASEVNVWHWRARFFRSQQQEEFRVEVDPAGRIVGMRHVVEEAREGARLGNDVAHAIAEEFLRARMKTALEGYDFLSEEANSTERPKRVDWSFTWERRGFKAKDAPYRLRVNLLGDSVGGYDEFLKVPEQWERDFERLRSSNLLYQFGAQVPFAFLLGATIVVIFDLGKRGLVRWRGTLLVGLLAAALFYVMHLNSFPLARSGYDTKSTYSGFVAEYVLGGLLASLGMSLLVLLPLAAGEPLYRRDYLSKLRLGLSLRLPGLRSKEFFNASVIGLAMAAAHIGFVVLFYVVGKKFGFWVPQEIKYTDALSTALPWIYPLAISIFAATSEEFLFRLFAIPFVLRVTKSKFLAIVLPAFIWGFLHSAYPVQPAYARGLEVGLIGLVAGWVMLRWGILATLVWHYTVDASLIGFFLLRSENLYFRMSGAIVAFAAVLPLAFAGVSYLVRRRFEADEWLWNQADPLVPKEMAAPAAPARVTRIYQALDTRRLGTAVLLGILGVVLALTVEPRAIGSFVRFATTPRQAIERGDEILRQRNVDPSGFRRVATSVSTFDAYATEYLRRQVGIEGANRLYEEKVPAAFWRVRYYRDSQKEEYQVILRLDGTVHSVHHLLEEKAPGANLSKEEAQARAASYLRDKKKMDLAQWKLVEATSDKRPARTDHTFIYEALEATGEAHVRTEVKVLGDEVSGYRVFVKIPEEWERKQKETSITDVAFTGFRILVALAFVVGVLVIFFRNLKQQRVPWMRMARWASWAGVAALVAQLTNWSQAMAAYPTEFPLKTWIAIMVMAQFLAVAFTFSGIFFIFGLAWFFLARACGEERLPSWTGMPRAYYREALILGLAGAGALAGLSRLRILAERLWPTDRESWPAAVPVGLDASWPAAMQIAGAVTAALFLLGVIGLVGGFLAGSLRRRWMQAAGLLLIALALTGGADSPAEFAKDFSFSLLRVGVVAAGVVWLYRFNMLAYALTAVVLSLSQAASQLLRQPAQFYQWNGYAVVAALLAALVWSLLAWRIAGGVDEAPPSEAGGALPPPDDLPKQDYVSLHDKPPAQN